MINLKGKKYKKSMRRVIQLLLLLNLCLASISAKSQQIAQAIRRALPVDSQAPAGIPRQASVDEQAKFLAGIDLPNDSALAPLQSTATYRDHARQFAKAWSNFNLTHFSKMQAWSQSELQPKLPSASVLLYMFGGPDFINAFALFPNMPIMVLGGLEPIGKVPVLTQLTEPQLAANLARLRTSTDSTLKWSFFIRKDMKVDLEQGDLRGVAPILYAFLALSGNTIEQADLIRAGGSPVLRIVYRQSASAPRQILYYVSANVVNGANRSLYSWLSSLGPSIGYLKAASYLLHSSEFSSVRDFLLTRCGALLQDDSGIPYRYFSPDRWQIYLYGKYTRPIELFKTRYQADLYNAYQNSGTVDFLPFGTGYQWRPGSSNLMLAVKKEPGQL
ncbi:MAG: hypothetical protein C5B47_08305 [Verrucomicrobia bacterium]|nr:MAG: hypothetical protein C5B47_08305 [Verrucomicrobiota bacterium]